MTTLILNRVLSGPDGTFGVLIYKSKPICVTCENPWLRNKSKISCIPPGNYDCIPHSGVKYKNVWELRNVPQRSSILIHNGNTIENTEGCILVGLGLGTIKGLPAVTASVAALTMLQTMLPKDFDLIVSGPSGMDYKY